MHDDDDLFDRCCQEILGLHAFFESWLRGTIPAADYDRLERALAPDFEMVTPAGEHRSRLKVLRGFIDAHGSRANAPGFAITIAAPRPRWVTAEAALVMYQEWHEGSPRWGRVSSALFAPFPDAPEGVVWVHLQETWLP